MGPTKLQMNTDQAQMKTLGQVAYESYCDTTGWKSLVSGAQLPAWSELKSEIRSAWEQSAASVQTRVTTEMPSACLTSEEVLVLKGLADAWNVFRKFEDRTTRETMEFQDAIHRAQDLIAMRVARRADPQVWRER